MAYSNKTYLPSCSRLLEKKWEERKLQAHHHKLQSIKPSIDNKPPQEFLHIKQNLRRAQIQRDTQATIDQHNRLLLHRMEQIMHTSGHVDHRNLQWQPKRSLNVVKKKHEMDRLMRENLSLLRRIEEAKPQYRVKKWENDFKRHQSLSKNLSILPHIQVSHRQIHTRAHTLPAAMEMKPHLPPLLPPLNTQGQAEVPQTESDIQEEIDTEPPAAIMKATGASSIK